MQSNAIQVAGLDLWHAILTGRQEVLNEVFADDFQAEVYELVENKPTLIATVNKEDMVQRCLRLNRTAKAILQSNFDYGCEIRENVRCMLIGFKIDYSYGEKDKENVGQFSGVHSFAAKTEEKEGRQVTQLVKGFLYQKTTMLELQNLGVINLPPLEPLLSKSLKDRMKTFVFGE